MSSPLTLPPGDNGWPLLGHTLSALSDIYAFLSKRREKYGACFRARILGKDVAFLYGPEGSEVFLDDDRVTREQAHPTHVRDLFGGVNMNMYSGPRHFALKSMALQAFDAAAISSYLPDMQQLVTATLERIGTGKECRAVDETRGLAIQAICKNVMGVGPGPVAEALRRDYELVTAGMLSVPVPLPGTTYTRARAARDRIFAVFRQMIADRRASAGTDGLSLILSARSADGRVYTDDEAILELHHIVIAGYIVFGLMIELFVRFERDAGLRDQVAAEVASVCPAGPITASALARMPLLARVVQEAKRTAPVLPLAFGRARRTFEFAGYTIPEGWGVWWALSLSNHDPEVFAAPKTFDPGRYAEGRAEDQKHPHAWVPQGSGPMTGHKCLGFDYSSALVSVFAIVLLRDYRFTIPEQNLDYFWNRTPAEPRDGLRIRIDRRA